MENVAHTADTNIKPILRLIPGGKMEDPKEKLKNDISDIIRRAGTEDSKVASATIMELCLSYRRGRWITALVSSAITILAVSLYFCLSR